MVYVLNNNDRLNFKHDFLLLVYCSPHDTPFEDGTFKLTIEFTEEYPNKPPTVRFVSKMFHPNGKCLLCAQLWFKMLFLDQSLIKP